jgi:hypothetical protein
MIMFGIGNASAAIITATPRFIQSVALIAAQTAIIFRIGHAATAVIAAHHVARFIKAICFIAAEAMIVFWVAHAALAIGPPIIIIVIFA